MNSIQSPENVRALADSISPVLDEALDALNASDREAILLRYFKHAPFAAIASRFDISADASRMRVERALERLREQLGRRGITSTAAALGSALGSTTGLGAPAGLAAAVTGAALAGSATIASGTGLALLLNLMSSQKVALVAAAVALAAAGVTAYQVYDREDPVITESQATADRTVTLEATSTPAVSFNASETESTAPDGFPSAREFAAFFSGDPKEVIARLRAAGYPAEFLIYVGNAFANARFAARIEALTELPPYWETGPYEINRDPEYRALQQEIGQYREEIIGEGYSSGIGNPFWDDPDWMQRWGFDILPEEKARAVWELRTAYLNQLQGDNPSRSSTDLVEIQRQLREAIAALLTPQEMLAYELRSSPTATNLLSQLQTVDYTEADFIALFQLRQPFDLKWPNGMTLTPELRQQRQRDLDQLEAEMGVMLGPERATMIQMSRNNGYRTLVALTDKLQLPRAAAAQAAAVQEDISGKREAALKLPQEEWMTAIESYREEANNRLRAILGESGLEAYRTNSMGSWLVWMDDPRYTP